MRALLMLDHGLRGAVHFPHLYPGNQMYLREKQEREKQKNKGKESKRKEGQETAGD